MLPKPPDAVLNRPVRSVTQARVSMLPRPGSPAVDWQVSRGLTDYRFAVERMESLTGDISLGNAPETVWLVEHPPLYTAGTSARDSDLIDPQRFPVHRSGRGGEFTYHGPGQRIVYVMFDLKRRREDVRAFVRALEDWIINSLAEFAISGERRADRVGVWVERPEKPKLADGTPREDKIAAIGIRLRRWVSFHGIAINVDTDLEHYAGIVPCGVSGHGVTSLVDLGLPVEMADLDIALRKTFVPLFGPLR